MNTQDRAVIKALLQKMTDKCLTGSDEFRAAIVYFNITTTFEFDRTGHWGADDEYIVDVFAPGTIAAGSDRYVFNTAQEAKSFAMNARATGDEPVNQRVLDAHAAHAEALEMDAEFNFERISREINLGDEPVSPAPADEPDAITVTEALGVFLDRWAVLDAEAVGKRYIVAFPSRCHDGKLIKHGTCNTREDAQTLLNNLPSTRGITTGLLVVLKLQ